MTGSIRRNAGIKPLVLAVAVGLGLGMSAIHAQSLGNVGGIEPAPNPSPVVDVRENIAQFILRFKESSSLRDNETSSALAVVDAAARAGRPARHLRRLAVEAEVFRLNKGISRAEAESFMRLIAADPNVEYIEIDELLQPILTPNDTRYGEQWNYFEATGGINAPAAWDVSTGTGTVIAVLDTGITSHSELNGNVIGGYDMIADTTVSNDGNGRDSNPADPGDWTTGQCGPASNSSWHGTHVAGTAAAVTNNASGVAGVAYNARIMPVRVLGTCGGYTSDIADGIIWASGGAVSGVPANSNPAEVINMSLGGSGPCGSTSQNAINGAVGRGTVIVVAAGNSNANVSGHNPGNCANVISVASTDRNGARSSFSNYGSLIDISAPGSGILSTLNTGSTTPGSASYASYSGTSMAAPHIAGVVALMQASSVKTPAQVETNLKNTARPLPGACSGGCGAGIVNARAAVDANGGTPPPPPPPPPGGTLTKGVAVTGLGASTGASLNYTMVVPAGSTNLTFNTSGGSGDADLYVKFGSAPTDTVYDCRPYRSGNVETCTFAAPSAGTYHVRLKAYSTFSGVSLIGDYTAGGGGGQSFFENTTDYTINDNATVDSPLTVSGRTGNAPSNLKVGVTIYHTWKGDLKVDLVAPDGSLYNIHNRTGGSADNVIGTFTINASSEVANGTWKLRVNDNANGDVGRIDKWSLQF